MDDTPGIRVVVVASPGPRQVTEVVIKLPAGATVEQALRASGLAHDLPLEKLSVGVWRRKTALNQPLREGDRVELYRPLVVDPKVARRERFARQGARSAGLFARKRAGAKAGY